VLLSKADYPAELDIPLPFSLLNNNASANQLEVLPAFWWQHNMYALARNTWKFPNRDKRKTKVQHIEFDSLAPDTVEEIFHARSLIEIWAGKAGLRSKGRSMDGLSQEDLGCVGREILASSQRSPADLVVLGENMEKSGRKVVLIKAVEGYHAYGQMAHYYAVKNLLVYLETHPDATFASLGEALAGARDRLWINLGGQLVPAADLDRLRSDVGAGRLGTWEDIHHRYDALWQEYPLAKQRHAWATLCDLLAVKQIDKSLWTAALDKAVEIQEYIRDQVYQTRKKDFDSPFRRMVYSTPAEMAAVLGSPEDNSFVKQVRKETAAFAALVESIKARG
jgi:hypothetical protein